MHNFIIFILTFSIFQNKEICRKRCGKIFRVKKEIKERKKRRLKIIYIKIKSKYLKVISIIKIKKF